ncbi:hypothetical protein [Kordia sp.]|uniref:hypothetical protein n=1 Tax=Kordia sp. TaxID=1965332 RepID=UPI0025BFF427|nr:hypothetical protein [Kordia sp.]MCH2192663.1 hypothetical protein [Kordia sp.]
MNLVQSETNKQHGVRFFKFQLRDITPSYKEGMFAFEKYIPNDKNPSISSVYSYRIRIITTKKELIFYEFNEEKNKKVAEHWKPYYNNIVAFKDPQHYEQLKLEFKKIFRTTPLESELFKRDIVYGETCIVGTEPRGRVYMKKLVDEFNKEKILEWLKSVNTEKQIYAVEALLQLKDCGIALTQQEEEIINFIIAKEGSIETCGGCSYLQREIKEVVRQFKR